MFNNLSTEGLEQAEDRIGGFQPLTTDIYTGPVKAFYAGESAGGAKNVTVIVDVGGKEYRETIYVTNKKGENFFLNKQDNTKKVPLPGFTTINDMVLVTCEKQLADLDFEEKTIKVYDPEAKKELPKAVPMAVEMIGKVVSLGIQQVLESKKVKNDATGEYEATEEERTINTIAKVFHTESHMTVPEATAGSEVAGFWDKWLDANKDKVIDKRDKNPKAGNAGRPPKPGAAPGQGEAASPAKSLFGAKK